MKKQLEKENKEKVIAQYQTKPGDTGSAPVQIALLTDRINHLTEHFKTHKQDKHGRRGLLQLVSERKKMLKYLEQTDLELYRELKKKLGIR